jgi:endogenous inhibitor of DNA gyrase (YacG/DUF329 family)
VDLGDWASDRFVIAGDSLTDDVANDTSARPNGPSQ